MSEKFHKGDRVRVNVKVADRYHLTQTAKRLKVKTLTGTVLTEQDPCCGCYVVEFDRKVGTDETYYFPSGGKKGYLEEVEPDAMTMVVKDVVRAAKAKAEAEVKDDEEPDEYPVGTVVRAIKTKHDYPEVKVGDVGVIIQNVGGRYGIRWERKSDGKHTLTGKVDLESGYWVPYDMVVPSGPEEYPQDPEFHEADRVVVVRKGEYGFEDVPLGAMGTIIKVRSMDIGVQFDEDFKGGHTLGGLITAKGKGYWVLPAMVRVFQHKNPAPPVVDEDEVEPVAEPDVKSVTVDLFKRIFTQEGYPVSPSKGYSGTLVSRHGSPVYVIIPFGKDDGSLIFEYGDERIKVR